MMKEALLLNHLTYAKREVLVTTENLVTASISCGLKTIPTPEMDNSSGLVLAECHQTACGQRIFVQALSRPDRPNVLFLVFLPDAP